MTYLERDKTEKIYVNMQTRHIIVSWNIQKLWSLLAMLDDSKISELDVAVAATRR